MKNPNLYQNHVWLDAQIGAFFDLFCKHALF